MVIANQIAVMGIPPSSGASGRVKWNVAPSPPVPLAQIRPPCDSTMDLLIAKPNLAVLPQLRSDREHAACLAHSLNSVQHQVHEHLLYLDPDFLDTWSRY